MAEKNLFDSEAEEESEEDGGGDGSGSDSSDEEEEENGQEVEGLINDQSEESGRESEGDNDDEEHEKRRRKKREYEDLLEEDYEMLEENLGVSLKKKRRVHLESDDEEAEVASVDTMMSRSSAGMRRGGKRMEMIRPHLTQQQQQAINDEELYSDSDQEAETQSRISGMQDQGSKELFGGAMTDSEDEDDFIVDELGRPINRKKGGDQSTDIALLEAQKVFGLDFDMEEFAQFGEDKTDYLDDEEQEEEYGEDADLEMSYRSKKARKKKQKGSIFDVYEPSELERGHFTDKDQEIRITDLPEQFLQRTYPVVAREAAELEQEAKWIYQQAFVTRTISKQPSYSNSDRYRPESTINKIKDTLDFICNQNFVIPYIANYKKEYVEPELELYDLWRIWAWDEKWCQLCSRKSSLKKLFLKVQQLQFDRLKEQPDAALTDDIRPLEEQDIERLEGVQTIEELNDVYSHFLLYYANDLVTIRNKTKESLKQQDQSQDLEITVEEGGTKEKTMMKHAKRRDFYTICQENRLGKMTAYFGLKPEQFGDNLRDGYQKHETEQHPVEPEECAAEFVQPTGHFSTVDAVLHGARHMVAMQIASDPTVRQVLRRAFRERAILSVRPTKKGKKEIDENSLCYGFKYLKNKPVRDLKGDQFLRIVQAEQDGLLVTAIRIDLDTSGGGRSFSTYFDEIKQYFFRDEFSLLVEKWNIHRSQALAHSLLRVLYPLMEQEVRSKLLQEAKDFITQYCVDKMHHWLNVAPYRAERELEDGDFTKIMGCSFTEDKDMPTFFVVLDACGEVVDFLKLNHFLKRKNSYWESEKLDKEADIEKLNNFLVKHRPDVIAVPASFRDALMVVTDIKQCLSDVEEEVVTVPVELVDPSVARIYAKSKRGKEEFPEYPEVLLEAISLSRRIQDPLMEFCALFASPEEEIFSLKMHVLQNAIPKENLYAAIQTEFIARINDVGIDLNLAIEHPHLLACVQFVAGIGPRKAAGLIKNLKQETSHLESRSQLVTVCSLGPKVFMNCAGFIKITNSTLNDSDTAGKDLLDCTRIHPETYEWARKMAVDALEYDEMGDDTNPNSVIEEIMESPEKLRDLDLDAFAEELERQGLGKKRSTLYDIRDELFDPYKDRRPQFASMELEEQFSLLTGETPESLYEGKLITCTVVAIVRRKPSRELLDRAQPIQNEMTSFWQCPFCLQDDFHDIGLVWNHIDEGSCPGQGIGVRTRLENGLSGFILTKNLSDKPVNTPEERVNIGRTIHCRILRVNLEKFSVDLTCRSSDLADRDSRFSLPRDTYYDHGQEEHDNRADRSSKQKPKNQYMKRVIVHPSFLNVSFKEAENALASMDQGDTIFRPSSKGSDHLTVTWKVNDSILQHIDIIEKDKPNAFSLGKSLWIGEEEFEDLDEILARFIHPMGQLARELHAHKSYRSADGGNINKLMAMLAEEKKQQPSRIPYFFSASKQLPGKYVLAYQPANKAKIEYLSLTPEGYRYRGLIHSDVNTLLKYFKEHYREPPPRPVVPGSAQPTPSASMIMTPGSIVMQQPYTPSQSIHQWSATPQYGQYGYQQAYRGHSAQASWQTPVYTPTQPVGTPIQTPGRTPHYVAATPQAQPASFGRGSGGQHKGRGGNAPWKQSSGGRRSHRRQ